MSNTGHELAAVRANYEEQLARARKELAERARRLASARAAQRRSDANARRARHEYDRLRQQVRYRLGDALVSALRPGRDTLLLPLRVATLFFQGLAQLRARRRARAQEDPSRKRHVQSVSQIVATASASTGRPPAHDSVPEPGCGPTPAASKLTGKPAARVVAPLALRAASSGAEADAAPRGVLFFCVNGAGLGHLTRSLAIARRLKRIAPAAPLRFLTSSKAVDVIEREGIPAHFIPPARTATHCFPANEWNAMLFERLQQIHREHRPRVLVYDGVFPYPGLMKAIEQGDFEHATMVLRLRHKNKMLRQKADVLCSFDELVFPGEATAEDPEMALPPELRALPHRFVDPIILLDPDELLSRDAARTALELDSHKRAVFIQLGAGNINSTRAWIDHILATLAPREDLQVVLAESPIADTPYPAREGVQVLRQYPNARYFHAFDLAIAAAGYNTFHELLHFGVPSILIPNQETRTDDQTQRALAAHRSHAGMAVLRLEDLADAIESALTDDVARTLRERSRALVPNNGARAVATFLQKIVGAPPEAPAAFAASTTACPGRPT